MIHEMFQVKKPIIAMIHVFRGSPQRQLRSALDDLAVLEKYVDGVIVENYGFGYLDGNLATGEAMRTMLAITRAVARRAGIPVGVNVLPNDYVKAFEICAKTGAAFVQLDHVTGEFEDCRPVDPIHLQSVREKYPQVMLLGGIHPKYYQPRFPDVSIADSALAAKVLADAVVVTGEYTGGAADIEELRTVKKVIGNHPLVIGSGLNRTNIEQLKIADMAVVGSAFKEKGVRPGEPVSSRLTEAFMDGVMEVRERVLLGA
jgi:predicted TIM-barrel enzyme